MFNVGDKVMMMCEKLHLGNPRNYPPKGTIGVVVECSLPENLVRVNWGKDSGVVPNAKDEYTWWCVTDRLEKVNANTANVQEENVNMNKFNVGGKVVFINADKHKSLCEFYPKVGTIGTIIEIEEKINEKGLLVDWGDAKGIEFWVDGTKSWWCNENDVKPYVQENNYTDDEVWEMLKPKMRQFVPAHIEDIDMFSPTVKDMVVAAYHSGYGRATKGRNFMIKPKVNEKPTDEKSIDDVLGGKAIVTFYKDDDSYNVANFVYADENGGDTRIYTDIFYSSAGDAWSFGFDTISDLNCEMYVAVPFSETVGKFDSKSIRALYCGDKLMPLSDIKPWVIGKYNGVMRFSNETRAFVEFKHEDGNTQLYPEIHDSEFKALVPLCEYLRVNGVNV